MRIILDSFSFDINGKSSNGMTALHWAYEGDHTNAITWLLRQPVDVTIVDKLSRTPLDCATQKMPTKNMSNPRK